MRVRNLGGLAELAARLAAAAENPALASTASAYLSEASIRQSLEAMFGLFPAAKVGVGDSWSIAISPSCGFPLSSRVKVTATKVATTKVAGDRIAAKIEGVIESGGEGSASELRGTESGSVDLDIASLRILGGSKSQNFTGTMLVRGTKIPMTVTSATRFE
jgi:hypothetical protein